MQRREALVLRAFGIWTIYVWVTRMWNILHDDTRSSGFKVVHSVLAVISLAFAVACLAIVRRVRSRPDVANGMSESVGAGR
jgi:Na+/melibiose symporter-like transporter